MQIKVFTLVTHSVFYQKLRIYHTIDIKSYNHVIVLLPFIVYNNCL
jgi:hypothetical protein